MRTTEYANMAAMEESYWWHAGRKRIIQRQMDGLKIRRQATILNIGCGTGGLIPLLSKYGQLENVDTSRHAIDFCRRRGFKNLQQIDDLRLPFANNTFDLLVATDVLEHIEDDNRALAEWYRTLKPGGQLIMTVPAYQWLWSEHDESLHHHRRYTASQLHKLVNRERFQVVKRSYIIVFSFPLIVGYRLARSIVPRQSSSAQSSYVLLPGPINSFFISLLNIESRIAKYINFPFGTSVLMIAEKPKSRSSH
jgi:SAM-dependent methyltransferase